ncbi:unnamed protein product [Boreogadus saida]
MWGLSKALWTKKGCPRTHWPPAAAIDSCHPTPGLSPGVGITGCHASASPAMASSADAFRGLTVQQTAVQHPRPVSRRSPLRVP